MTCIVCIIDKANNRIIIGGDSAGVSGHDITKRKDTKVFVKDNRFIIGFTSSFRMGQILHYNPFHVEEQSIYEDDLAFMVKKFVPAVQKLFAENGWAKKDRDGETTGGTFLVGYKNNLYCIEDDFQVGLSYKCYASCGCGESYALGSLYSTPHLSHEERVIEALKAAAEFNGGVSGPFTIKTLEFKK
jgi:ATP-dependent protease HslVU (ClpYQ) peptidase subunit